ncbi:alpha/beta hydrolase family protein [Parabacteroides sp. FAFU027]|uniref:alpha/beta hydrolase family protein n=1 Tax=Parabacteroides sp. FAFU027 TaxID=2922715 RepID=UPI001FAFC9F2|nr:alpha/beta hydrolase [Parabacteroides sp. FAFU027]
MKKILAFAALFIALCNVSAKEVTGDWNGTLNINGMKLRVVFHILKTDKGYSATMDSPDQGAKGIPMTSATYDNKTLTLLYDAAKINYSGQVINSDSIAGTFTQMGISFPLGLSRKASVSDKPKRPQEPTPPFPYKSENITFTHTTEKFTLAGTFTYPANGKNFPVVVLISGSGPQNRDEEIMGHKPFLVLADYLTRNGIAVLRFDDRGCYDSKGDFSRATTNDFVTDVESAIAYLKTRKEINPKKIGLIGHSEGGIIAPLVASHNKDVSYIVMIAGTGAPGSEILLRQQELIGRVNGAKEEDLNTTKDLNSHIFKMIHDISNTDTLKARIAAYLLQKSKELPESKIPPGSNINDIIDIQLKQITNPWMLNFLRYDPAPTLTKVHCPVLAIIGSKDLQVPADINIPAIEKALKQGGKKKYTVKELPGLNHLLQECKTGSPNEYPQIEQTISPTALSLITGWIKSVCNMH